MVPIKKSGEASEPQFLTVRTSSQWIKKKKDSYTFFLFFFFLSVFFFLLLNKVEEDLDLQNYWIYKIFQIAETEVYSLQAQVSIAIGHSRQT